MTFTKKILELRFTLSAGSFGGGGNQKIIRGLSTDVSIEKVGAPDLNKARIKISGMLREDMEQLTFLAFRAQEYQLNYVEVFAGNEGAELSLVFKGQINKAAADYSGAPDISFQIEAMTGSYALMSATPPMSVEGEAPVSDVVGSLAGEMGYAFENAGTTAAIKNTTLNGSPLEKARAAANQTGDELIVDDDTIILLPEGRARKTEVPEISAESGLIGYPSFSDTGVNFKCIYNPAIILGGLVQLNSIVPHASGLWRVVKLSHHLSACNPAGGAWETSVEGMYHVGQ